MPSKFDISNLFAACEMEYFLGTTKFRLHGSPVKIYADRHRMGEVAQNNTLDHLLQVRAVTKPSDPEDG